MGLLAWLRGLFARGDAPTVAPDAGGTRRCTVCGTTVGPDATECPLCHGSDLVAVGEADAPSTGGPAPERTSRAGTTDDDAGRLREVRERHGEE